jgi:NADH dehydrogenase
MVEGLNLQTQDDPTVADPRPAEISRADELLKGEGLHKIVVVGGGAAGLELVTRLGDRLGRRRRAGVTLVESARTHLWKPLLHEVAAGSVDPGDYELNYLAQAHWHRFRYRLGEMTGLDRAVREVHLAAAFDDEGRQITPPRSVEYDTLVIAIGSVTNDFGTPGVVEHAVPLETPAQAARFNRRLVNACIRAETQDGPVRPGQLHVAIVGAGATGAELAAELHRTTREVVAYGLDRIDPERDIRIVLIEAADRILPGLPERISEAARRLLDRIGIEVHTGAKVTEVTADGLRLADGSLIASELVVWRPASKPPRCCGTSMGWRSTSSASSWSTRHCRPRAIPTSSLSATVPPVRARTSPLRCRRAHRPRTRRPHIWCARSSVDYTASHFSPTHTGISARWCPSASTVRWGT